LYSRNLPPVYTDLHEVTISSMTGSLRDRLRFAREKYGFDIASIIMIFFGLAALLILLSPR
jgi:hypothetical protein